MNYFKRLCGLALLVIAIPLSIPGLLVVGIVFVLPLFTVFFLFNLIQELWEDEYKEFANESDPFPVHPFDEWVYERCLSPDTGAGVLIRAWNGHRLAKYFERRNPGIEIIQVWSAPVCFKRDRMRGEAKNSRVTQGVTSIEIKWGVGAFADQSSGLIARPYREPLLSMSYVDSFTQEIALPCVPPA